MSMAAETSCPMCESPMQGIFCTSDSCCLGGRSPYHPSHDPPRMTIDEAFEVLGGAKVVFGLHAQGHAKTIERMLSEGASWDAIGEAIGWDPATAKRHWKRAQEQR